MHRIHLLVESTSHIFHNVTGFLHEHSLSYILGLGTYGSISLILSAHTESMEKAAFQIAGGLATVVFVTVYKALWEDEFKAFLKSWKEKRASKKKSK